MQIQDLINIEYALKHINFIIGSLIFISLGSLWLFLSKKKNSKSKTKNKESSSTPKSNKSTKTSKKTLPTNNTTINKETSPKTNIKLTNIDTPITITTNNTSNTVSGPISPSSNSTSHSLFIKTVKSLGDTIETIKFSPDGKYLAFCGTDRSVKLFLAESLLSKTPQSFNLHLPFDQASSISWGHKCIYASLKDTQKLICYNILDQKNQEGKTYEQSWSVPLDTKSSCIKSICSSSQSPYILTCGDDTILKIWTLKGQLLQTINTGQIKNYMAASTIDGKFFGVASFSSEVKIYEAILKKDGSLDQCKRVMSLSGYKSSINSLCFSSDGTKVITASTKDEGIKLWNLNIKYQMDVDPECIYSVQSETGPIQVILISPDTTVFVGLNQHSISFYNLSNGSLIDIIHTSQIFKTIAWSPDSKYVVTGGSDKLLYLWSNPKFKSK